MDDSPADDDLFAPGSLPAVVYSAMLGATIAGQFLGIGIDTLLGWHTFLVPGACSVVLEAVAGARLGARAAGHPLDATRSAQLSGMYSLALIGVTVPLAIWLGASRHALSGDTSVWTAGRIAGALAALAVATVARWALMLVFAPRVR